MVGRATALFREKVTDEHGHIYEAVIWEVERSTRYSEGVRYRLAFIKAGEKSPTVLYDNHHPKGHHRHLEGIEEPYKFTNVNQLLADFMADVGRRTGGNT